MSSPHYIWWSYVQGMIKKYPERAAALRELQSVGVTAKYSDEPSARRPGRTTETVALRQLPPTEQREYDAVRKALDHLATIPNGDLRLRMVRLVYWDRTHRLFAAAQKIGISTRTASRWNSVFIRDVARNYGLLQEKMACQSQDGVVK